MRCRAAALTLLMALGATACRTVTAVPTRVAATADFPRTLSFSLLEDYDKGEALGRVARDFEIMHELGITTWRGSFGWDDYEPESGVYDLEWLHAFVELAREHRITLRPYLGYTPAWAAAGGSDDQAWNDPPRDLTEWRGFVRTVVSALRNARHLASYEIYNEENAPLWWDGTAAEYAAALKAAAQEIRASDPDAEVILGGLTYPDVAWLEAVCETYDGARAFDIAAFHAYAETWSEPDITAETYLDAQEYHNDFLGTLAHGCADQPLWVNEAGYATTPGRSEVDQAAWWARTIATFAADSAIQHIGVYEIRDLPPDQPVIGDAPNYHLGLIGLDGTRKLAFHTVRLLAGFFEQPFRVQPLPLATADRAGVYGHTFHRADGARLLVVWSTQPRRIRLDLPSGAREVDLSGRRHTDSPAPVIALDARVPRLFVVSPP